MASLLEDIASDLQTQGLIVRGGFSFDDATPAPPPGLLRSEAQFGSDGVGTRSVLLVGQAGAASWQHFLRWRSAQPSRVVNPLDTWSREIIGAVAEKFGARAVSPSDKPYLPFQQWAMRAEGLKPSPLGVLMHPRYGLWHAYRGALLFAGEIAMDQPRETIHLCDICVGKPCLNACPVDAYSEAGFAYGACVAHVRGASGQACRHGGCLDRNACPYGADFRYPAEVQAFHMAAFAGI